MSVIANLDEQVAKVFRLATRDAADEHNQLDRANDEESSEHVAKVEGDATSQGAKPPQATGAKLDDGALAVWLL